MPDARQRDGIWIRHKFTVAIHHVLPGHRVQRTVNHSQRHLGPLQRADPAFAVGVPLRDIADEPVHDPVAAFATDDAPEFFEFAGRGPRVRPKIVEKLRAKAWGFMTRPRTGPSGESNNFWIRSGRWVSGNRPPFSNTQDWIARARPSFSC